MNHIGINYIVWKKAVSKLEHITRNIIHHVISDIWKTNFSDEEQVWVSGLGMAWTCDYTCRAWGSVLGWRNCPMTVMMCESARVLKNHRIKKITKIIRLYASKFKSKQYISKYTCIIIVSRNRFLKSHKSLKITYEEITSL